MIKTWTIKKVMAMAVVTISLVTVTGCTGDLNKIMEWVNAHKSSVSEDQRMIPTANVAVRTTSDELPVSSTEKKSSQVLTTQSELPESAISKPEESNSAPEESVAPVPTADLTSADSSTTSVSQESTTSTEWYQVTGDVIEGDGDARGIAVYKEIPEYFLISFYASANDDVPISNVRIAVWTEANGQDDIEWINAETNGVSARTTIYAKNHNNETSGYIVHVYYTDRDGVEKVYYNPETISIP